MPPRRRSRVTPSPTRELAQLSTSRSRARRLVLVVSPGAAIVTVGLGFWGGPDDAR